MIEIQLAVPEELTLVLQAEQANLAAEVSMAAAVKLYELGKLSAGAAAELAGIPKPLFMGRLADYGVPNFDLTEEELQEDLKNA
jgi:predicted HTH domain antitoxin